MSPGIRRTRLLFTPLLVALSALAGCQNDPVEPDEEPEIEIARLTIGAQTVNLIGGSGASVTIPMGSTVVSAVFLDADGATLSLPTDEFELRMESQNTARVTFARTGPFSGTLTGISAGAAVVKVAAYHLVEQHEDFGPSDLNVTVQ